MVTEEKMLSDYVCEVCGQVRMQTQSGTVCPDGHGMLHPKAERWQLKRVRRLLWMKSLPLANRGKGKKTYVEGRVVEVLDWNPGSRRPHFVPTGASPPTPRHMIAVFGAKGRKPKVRLVREVGDGA